MDWIVKKSSLDTERTHLNRILQEIQVAVDALVASTFTTEMAQDAVGTILGDTSTLDFTYNDGANTITAAVLDSPLLQGQNGAYYLARGSHTGTQDWSTITGTPVTLAGYGITGTLSEFNTALTGADFATGGGTATGTNTGDQTITLTGDVTGTGTGTFATTLANTAVTPGSYTHTSITVDSTGRITAASSGGVGTGTTYIEPAFASVHCLLHMEGSNGGTTFTDQIGGNTWTATAATTSTAQAWAGSTSALFTGASNSRISCPQNSNFDVGASNWAIEYKIWPVGSHQASARMFQTRDGDTFAGISISHDGAGSQTFGLYLSSNGTSHDIMAVGSVGTLIVGMWNSVVIQKRGPYVQVWVNEAKTHTTVLTAAQAAASIYYNATHTVVLGGQSGTSRSINGYVDEFRFTYAYVARDIGLPTSAFPDS